VDDIGGQMRAYENTIVDIEGNTDSTGQRSYNMQLSRQRADAVRQYLMEKYGFPGARLRTVGNGPDKPLDNNATPEGRERTGAQTSSCTRTRASNRLYKGTLHATPHVTGYDFRHTVC